MIYVVMGSCGEYSDHQEWAVRAFYKEKDAQEHVLLLDSTWREAKVKYAQEHGGYDYYFGSGWSDDDWKHPHDPGFTHDHTGTNYYVMEVPLEDEEAKG